MNYTVIDFVVVASLMYAVALVFSPETVGRGLQISFRTLTDPNIGLIPLVIAATLISGLAEAAIPKEVISSFLGEEAGLKGLDLGTFRGIVILKPLSDLSLSRRTLQSRSGGWNDHSVYQRVVTDLTIQNSNGDPFFSE